MRPTILSFVLPFIGLPIALQAHDHGKPAEHAFVENLGQWNAPFLFRADVIGATLFVERDGWTWCKLEDRAAGVVHDMASQTPPSAEELIFQGHAWRMRFVNAAAPQVNGMDRAKHYHNYFLGNDPARWKGHVGVHGKVKQTAVWPGVDVVLSTQQGRFKYDILIEAGADADMIGMAYEGLDGLSLADDGSLQMRTSVGDLLEMAPVAFYSDQRGGALPCAFALEGDVVRFIFPNGRDAARPVTIDPLLIAATLSGATGASNYGHCATYDWQGNIYTGARNFGPSYPVTPGAFQTSMGGGGTDMSFSKYNPDGSDLIWASYLGGNSGENPHSMIVDGDQQLIVLGSSHSVDFPVTEGAFDDSLGGTEDIILTHFAIDGASLVGSTFIGGSGDDGLNNMFGNYGEAYRGEVFLEPSGDIIVASFSSSYDFPVTPNAWQDTLAGEQDAVVLRMDPECTTLMASTYVGGSLKDNAMGIRFADNGDLFVTGVTLSPDFPIGNGGYQPVHQGSSDAYVLRLTFDLTQRINGSFLGTSDEERAYFLDLDSEGSVWIYGQCEGSGIAISPDTIYGEADGGLFTAKFTYDLSDLPVSTVFGTSQLGGTVSAPVAFMVDECDHIYISGYNSADGLDVTSDALYNNLSFYVAVFEVGMDSMIYGTYYGGSHVDGGTSRFDRYGTLYQGVCSGEGSLQTTPWAWAETQTTGWDIGVFKIDMQQCEMPVSVPATHASQNALPLWTDAQYLWLDLSGTTSNAGVTLFDAAGRVVLQQSGRPERTALDIGHLSAGTYQVVVTTGDSVLKGRFIRTQ